MQNDPTKLANAIADTLTIRQSLLAMGYQEQSTPGYWVKPVGYHCFAYHEGKAEWVNCFCSYDQGKILVWDSHKFQEDFAAHGAYVDQLKYFECFTRTDIYSKSNFELKAIDL